MYVIILSFNYHMSIINSKVSIIKRKKNEFNMKERKQMFYEHIYNYVTLNLKPFYYWILMIKIIPKQTIRVFLHCLQS